MDVYREDLKRKRGEDDDEGSIKKPGVQCPSCNLPIFGELQDCDHCGRWFCARQTCGPAHLLTFGNDSTGHNCCAVSKQQCSHCLGDFCWAHSDFLHHVTFNNDPSGHSCCPASLQQCLHCNGNFCGVHSLGAHQTAANDSAGHICCNASFQQCGRCQGDFCGTHSVNAHQGTFGVDSNGHNYCVTTQRQCSHCGVNYCTQPFCWATHQGTFALDLNGDNCCPASRQQCARCNGNFCGVHSVGTHQGTYQQCSHCLGNFCDANWNGHQLTLGIDAAGDNCCDDSLEDCPYCSGKFCRTHSVPKHEIIADGCGHKTCTFVVGKCPTCGKTFCEKCSIMKVGECEVCDTPFCDLCKPCAKCAVVRTSASSESFQWNFIRLLHTGNDDPQDHSARSINACRSGLNTISIDGLDIGIASWNINHFQKAEKKTASIQRIFSQHQDWLDILALQEVNASSDLKIRGVEIEGKDETNVGKNEKEKIVPKNNNDGNSPKPRKLAYSRGPLMMGLRIGKEPKNSHKNSTANRVETRLGAVGGEPAWLTPIQQEYYPLVYLTGGKYQIKYLTKESGAFYLNEFWDKKKLDGEPLYWNKQFGTDGDGTDDEQDYDEEIEILPKKVVVQQKAKDLKHFDVGMNMQRDTRSSRKKQPNYKDMSDDQSFEDSDEYSGETQKEKKEIRQEKNMREINPKKVAEDLKFDVDLTKIPYFRPIIVHKLTINGKPVNIAVVHTSPEGGKLARKGEYDQIAPFLDYISKDDSGALWVIAGDYYLDPESNIASNSAQEKKSPDELFKEQIKAKDLKFVISVSATNQSILTRDVTILRRKNLKEREELKKKIEKTPKLIFDNLSQDTEGRLKRQLQKEFEEKPEESSIKFIGLTKPYETKFDSVERKVDGTTSHVVNKRADFFICSPGFTNTFAGIINPLGGLLNVDPNHNALNWWRLISDHAPVGAVFSTLTVSEKLRRIRKDENLYHKERWKKAEEELTEILRKAYDDIYLCFKELDSKIEQDWMDGLGFEKTLFHHLLFFILNDPRFKFFRSFQVEEAKFLYDPMLAANQMMEFFELCQNAQNYDAFKGIYLKYNKVSKISDNTSNSELTIDPGKPSEEEIKKKSEQIKSSELTKIVLKISPSLRALGYQIDDFDVTAKDQIYKDVDNEGLK